MSRVASRRIFISYRREDTAAYAGRLYDRLSQHFGKLHVFMDVDSIKPGDDFIDAIRDAVGSCDILLLLIGPKWLTSADSRGRHRIDDPTDFVYVELETALKRDIRIIPILVDRAGMPTDKQLPPTLKALWRRQAFELSHSQFRTGLAALIEKLEEDSSSKERRVRIDRGSVQKSWPTSDWRLVRVRNDGPILKVSIARNEIHQIEHTAGEMGRSSLTVDGKAIKTGNTEGLARVRWTFHLVDAGESVPATLLVVVWPTGKGVAKYRLEVNGNLIHEEG